MQLKIIVTVATLFFSITSFSQTKVLLLSFERHTATEEVYGCFPGKGEHNDYTIKLFSDSTFIISYWHFANAEYQRQKIGSRINIKGVFFSRNRQLYLQQNNLATTGINYPDEDVRKIITSTVKIDLATYNLVLYISPNHFLSFGPTNPINKIKNKKDAGFYSTTGQ